MAELSRLGIAQMSYYRAGMTGTSPASERLSAAAMKTLQFGHNS
jgi:hypothetical protein